MLASREVLDRAAWKNSCRSTPRGKKGPLREGRSPRISSSLRRPGKMIGNESCDFLRENDHRYNEHEGRPKQHGAQVIPFHRAQGCAALLPESNSQRSEEHTSELQSQSNLV